MKFSAKFSKLISIISLGSVLGLSPTLNASMYAESGFILTSIKPLQLIAQDITEGVIKSIALLPPGASPHAYALRPSDVKKIVQAKNIYWVGPQLESFLKKPFSKYSDKSYALAPLADAEAIVDKPLASGVYSDKHTIAVEDKLAEPDNHQDLDSHDNDDGHDGHDGHAVESHLDHDHNKPIHIHQYQGADSHIWLSPDVALRIAQTIKAHTITLYPQHTARLEQNYEDFAADLEALDLRLNAEFSSLKGLGFLVFHDAYSRFNEHYQLNQIGALTINPAKRPGAKHLSQIRQQIAQSKPLCIFSEPQFSTVAIKTVIRGTDIKEGVLDPLATEHHASKQRYVSFLDDFAQRIILCLGNA